SGGGRVGRGAPPLWVPPPPPPGGAAARRPPPASVISVDGDGTVRRCHFVAAELGNLYDGSYRAALRPRPCPLAVCDCHIGYVHLESLPLYDVFAGGVRERVPAPPPPVGSWSVGHTVSPSIPLVMTSVAEPHVTGTESPLPRPSPPG
ncbi:STM4011 family radical SAM protein, partial [Streptomyces antimycoticus]